jgi:ABC-type uncharacterized transport system auxiliary subunit
MKFLKPLLIITALAVTLSACHEGPAEKKGKKLDNAVEKVQDKINPKGPAQKTGEKIDEATGN